MGVEHTEHPMRPTPHRGHSPQQPPRRGRRRWLGCGDHAPHHGQHFCDDQRMLVAHPVRNPRPDNGIHLRVSEHERCCSLDW